MDKVKYVRLEQQDGSYSNPIPLVADGNYVDIDGENVITKLNKKPYYYDTVADMKADTKLKIGDMAVTLGYYEPNDGGNSEYRIVSGTYTDDGGSHHKLENGLFAQLIIKNNIINFMQFGAKADNLTDDSQYLQAAINYCINRKINLDGVNKTYITSNYIQNENNFGILINGNINLKNANFKLKDYSPDLTCILLIDINSNETVKIENCTFNGNKSNQLPHTTPSQDGGRHGIRFYRDGNIIIKNCKLYDCYTDNIVTIDGNSKSIIEDCEVYGAGRNGILIGSYQTIVKNCSIHNNGTRTAPKSGIHIEPNHTSLIDSILIDNCKIFDNVINQIKFHMNEEGHHINSIKIKDTDFTRLSLSLNGENGNYSDINLLEIINSIGDISAGYVSLANNSGIKKYIVKDSTINTFNIKQGIKGDVFIDNTFLGSYLWLYSDIKNLIVKNSDFISDEMPETDSQPGCGIITLVATIDNLLIDNCKFINKSRACRLLNVTKMSVLNSYFEPKFTAISGNTIDVLNLMNNKFKAIHVGTTNITKVFSTLNDFSEVTDTLFPSTTIHEQSLNIL